MNKNISLFLLYFGLLFLFSAFVIYEEYVHLDNAKEIKLSIQTRDPRDLLRGNYLTINTEINNLYFENPSDTENPLYLILKKQSSGFFIKDTITQKKPNKNSYYLILNPDQRYYTSTKIISFKPLAERYYLNENTAQKVEAWLNNNSLDSCKNPSYITAKIHKGKLRITQVTLCGKDVSHF